GAFLQQQQQHQHQQGAVPQVFGRQLCQVSSHSSCGADFKPALLLAPQLPASAEVAVAAESSGVLLPPGFDTAQKPSWPWSSARPLGLQPQQQQLQPSTPGQQLQQQHEVYPQPNHHFAAQQQRQRQYLHQHPQQPSQLACTVMTATGRSVAAMVPIATAAANASSSVAGQQGEKFERLKDAYINEQLLAEISAAPWPSRQPRHPVDPWVTCRPASSTFPSAGSSEAATLASAAGTASTLRSGAALPLGAAAPVFAAPAAAVTHASVTLAGGNRQGQGFLAATSGGAMAAATIRHEAPAGVLHGTIARPAPFTLTPTAAAANIWDASPPAAPTQPQHAVPYTTAAVQSLPGGKNASSSFPLASNGSGPTSLRWLGLHVGEAGCGWADGSEGGSGGSGGGATSAAALFAPPAGDPVQLPDALLGKRVGMERTMSSTAVAATATAPDAVAITEAAAPDAGMEPCPDCRWPLLRSSATLSSAVSPLSSPLLLHPCNSGFLGFGGLGEARAVEMEEMGVGMDAEEKEDMEEVFRTDAEEPQQQEKQGKLLLLQEAEVATNSMAAAISSGGGGGRGGDLGGEPTVGGKNNSSSGKLARGAVLSKLATVFDFPASKAARLLGLSATGLKRQCRYVGIHRWPQRKLNSLQRLSSALAADVTVSEKERLSILELVAKNRADILSDPNAPLLPYLKTLRQTQYKQSHDRRVIAATAAAVAAAVAGRSAVAPAPPAGDDRN
ncbi:hypothetical protein Agub_g7148, partial [Astrephomene gubernaculifera]